MRMQEQQDQAFRAMSEAVLAIAADLAVESTLQKLVEAARDLVGSKYAALGVPDGEGAFAQFLTSGMSDELMAAIGPLPRTHGILGAMLESPRPYRTSDIRTDSRFHGGWPPAHPDMRSFMGVPIVSRGGVIGAFYLTEKEGADEFSDDDEHCIEMLAAHAAVAIENARLFERSRELSIAEERNRLARDLHDSVTQKLFGVVLTAEAAATLLDREPDVAREQLERLKQLAQDAMEELRSLIFELRPPALEIEGLVTTLRKHVDVLRRAYRFEIGLQILGNPALPPSAEGDVFRIAQEALQNALRHSQARRVDVRLDAGDGGLTLVVSDDGIGFEPGAPALRSRRLGLTSMEERARSVGGTLAIQSAPGAGTTVRLEVAS
jgi:signal transduction histidine kinase